LRIYLEGVQLSWGPRDRRLKAYLSVKELDALSAHGGSDVYISAGLKGDKISLSLHGGSDFSGKIFAGSLDIDQHGGSDVSISGTATNLKVKASGGSDFKGFELIAENAVIDANGGSDARLTVTKELAVEASGGSDIDYKGTPVIKQSSSRGGSSISRRN
jgi:hypothetical protein